MSVLLGDVYSASYTAPATATVVLTVTAADGTITTPAVVTTAAPVYTATVPAAIVGAYLLTWVASGAATDVYTDQFTAIAPALQLISMSDLKDQLNLSPTDATSTNRLRRFIQSATDVVENITGPMRGQSRTEYFDGNRSTVVLSARWVQSITTVTEILGTSSFTLTEQPLGGGSATQYGYTWDRNTHKITRRSNGVTGIFPAGDGSVAVTYKLGINPLPQDISDAAGELIRHWWQNGQQPRAISFTNTGADDDTGTITSAGYWVPNRVNELLAPYALGPVLA
jgi:hypothetical protein